MALRILLADDHKVLRQGLRGLIEKNPSFLVVGEADNGSLAVKLAAELMPDVIIMDVSMPQLNGVEATRRIRHECRDTKVIALSMRADRHYVMGMLKAGASSYLFKDCSYEQLSTAITEVHRGGTYMPPEVAQIVMDDLHLPDHERQKDTSSLGLLTSREREILQLIAEAKKSKEIAEALNISIKTVYTHRRNIMDKLNARNLADLTRYAIQEGLVPLEE